MAVMIIGFLLVVAVLLDGTIRAGEVCRSRRGHNAQLWVEQQGQELGK